MNWLDRLLSGEGSNGIARFVSIAAACAALIYLWISKVKNNRK